MLLATKSVQLSFLAQRNKLKARLQAARIFSGAPMQV
jgi:hypothetical protein